MTDNLPARIDRAAIERIIQRATELQTGERDIGEGMSPDEVVSLGKDVGIPERYLRQAILEEHGRVVPGGGGGLLDRVVGAAEVTAQRVVSGTAEDVAHRLRDYLEREELLALQREQPGRITWEPLRGVEAAIRRTMALGGRKSYMLTHAELVSASVTALEPGYCHVTLSASLRGTRNGYIAGMTAIGVVGTFGATVLAILSPFALLAALPVAGAFGIGWLIARSYPPVAARALLGLERTLDFLERGAVKPTHQLAPGPQGLLGVIVDQLRKAPKG